MDGFRISTPRHTKDMVRLKDNTGVYVAVRTVGPSGIVVLRGKLEDVKPFQAIWIAMRNKLRNGNDGASSGQPKTVIQGIDFVGTENSNKVHNNHGRDKALQNLRIRRFSVYNPKNKTKVAKIRSVSFGRRIANALTEPQIGENPVVSSGRYPAAAVQKSPL